MTKKIIVKSFVPEIGDIVLGPLGTETIKKVKLKILEIEGSFAKVQYVERAQLNELGNKPFLVQLKNLSKLKTDVQRNNDHIIPEQWLNQDLKRFPSWINEVFMPYRLTNVNKNTKGNFELRLNQKFIRDYLSLDSPYRGLLLYHGLGSGKCMAKGTELLMYDGSIKKIENIKIGDLLMGDDSKPRTVLSLARGKDKMYEVSSKNKDFMSYTVNSVHILCLKCISNENVLGKTYQKGDILEIEVEDFLKLENQKSFLGFKSTGETSEVEVKYKNNDEYYGFELDGNGRYLLADFTVTHNTCSSIAVAENLKNAKNVVVLSPASLRSNYIHQLIYDCGVKDYKNDPKKVDEKYTFVSYNASNTVDQLKRIGSLDNHTIVIDEVHNLVSMMVSKSKKGPEIYKMLMDAKNIKIVALSGTPIINFPFEVAILSNILRGYLEIATFFIKGAKSSNSLQWKITTLKNKLMDMDSISYVDNYQKYFYIYSNYQIYEPEHQEMVKEVLRVCKEEGVEMQYLETKKFTLFPDDEDEFRSYFIEETPDGELLKNIDLLKRRMLGLISYYRGGKPQYYPKVNETITYEIPMSDYQFREYEKVRAVELEKEKTSAMKKILGQMTTSKSKNGMKKKVSSLFRVFSRELSNFVFPEEIERPFLGKFLKSIKKKRRGNNVSLEELEDLKKENEIQENKNVSSKDKKVIEDALDKLAKKKDIYLKDTQTGLKKLSPKMAKMLENINKSPGLVFVYSAFRTLEGIAIFSLVLEANGWAKYDVNAPNKNSNKPRYAVWSGAEDEETREKIRNVFVSPENKYGEKLKALLATSAGAEGIDLKNIRQVHIMEPYWHEVRIAQVIGRAVRLNSHIELPEKDRTVDVFRYQTIYSDKQKEISKEKQSTDEYIYEIAKKKLVVTDEIKQTMKEIAVDCTLNAADNEKGIKCFNFGQDLNGLAYKADIKEDFIYGRTELGTKNVKKNLKPMFMDENKNVIYADKVKKKLCYFFNGECMKPLEKAPKKTEKIAVDMDTYDVYDFESAKSGNPIKIGIISQEGKVV